jgi:hypothetical protein
MSQEFGIAHFFRKLGTNDDNSVKVVPLTEHNPQKRKAIEQDPEPFVEKSKFLKFYEVNIS